MGSRTTSLLFCCLFSVVVAACGPSATGTDDDTGGGDDEIDAPPGTPIDARVAIDAEPPPDAASYPDAIVYSDGGACDTWQCANPNPNGCMPGTDDICGNGADDNCDTNVDEGCGCTPGAVQACFRGPPGKRNVGSCVDGQQTCFGSGEFTSWGPCTGGISPQAEACDGQDNDCNGCDDDNPECCVVELACPGPDDMPDGAPFENYVIDGTAFFAGATTSWSWTVTGGPCDELFLTTTNPVRQTYTVTGASTPTMTLRPTLSGDYTVRVVIVAADGTVYECTFIVHIGGPGLRIETCSDVTATTDLDLHVHRPGTTTPWFTTSTNLNNTTVNPDDCYYMDCAATTYGAVANWGYASSPIGECNGGPEGADWANNNPAVCRNPRLDIDSINDNGVPENINIDNPVNGASYRVMVHYYAGTAVAHPIVNVYCGGYLLGSYGRTPDVVTGFQTSGGFGRGQMWRVVDAVTAVDGNGVTTGCTLNALHPPGTTSGYYITNNNRAFD